MYLQKGIAFNIIRKHIEIKQNVYDVMLRKAEAKQYVNIIYVKPTVPTLILQVSSSGNL